MPESSSAWESPFAWRYGRDAMRAIFSHERYRRLWRRVWLALATAQQPAGLLTEADLAAIRARVDVVDLAAAAEIEARIKHDVVSELRVFARQVGPAGGRLHLGATSADITDNADALRLREALALLEDRLADVLAELADLIERTAALPALAYTHLQPAEPTTLGYRFALHAQDLLEDLEELGRLRAAVRGKGFKGAVGTSAGYARLLAGTGVTVEQMEAEALRQLGLEAYPVASQTYPRKQDYRVLAALAGLAASLAKAAFDLRVLQSGPFGEVGEPYGAEQVGSSAMPFKQNPELSERISSLARFVAALPQVAWGNAADALLERTLDDSANRRVIIPEAFLALDECLLLAKRVYAGLRIHEARLAANLATFGPFIGAEPLLMELARRGADRQRLHEVIRRHAAAAWEAVRRGEPNPLADALAADPEITAYLSPAEVRAALDPAGDR